MVALVALGVVSAVAVAATINGTNGNDTLIGTAANNTINACYGNDSVEGGGRNDTIDGGTGNDRLVGDGREIQCPPGATSFSYCTIGQTSTPGNDSISGGSGNDRIFGNAGRDSLSGGTGNDRISGESGNDSVSGGSGRDRISGGSGNDRIRARDNTRDTINCGSGRNDRVTADRSPRDSDCERVFAPLSSSALTPGDVPSRARPHGRALAVVWNAPSAPTAKQPEHGA